MKMPLRRLDARLKIRRDQDGVIMLTEELKAMPDRASAGGRRAASTATATA